VSKEPKKNEFSFGISLDLCYLCAENETKATFFQQNNPPTAHAAIHWFHADGLVCMG
jgi:hypothetical protein